MTNLQRRLEADRRRRERKKTMQRIIRNLVRKTLAFIVTLAMLMAIGKAPVIYAYFTGKATSSPVYFEVSKSSPGNASANVVFDAEFLIEKEEEDEGEPVGGVNLQSSLLLFGNGEEIEVLDTGGDSPTAAEDPRIIYAYIWLADDFEPGDLYIPSIRVRYEGESTPALYGDLDGDKLQVAFDRNVMSSWFDQRNVLSGEAEFLVAGLGYIDGLYPFDFTGTATLKLDGNYDITAVKIQGEDNLFLPDGSENLQSTYELVDQDGKILQGAAWSLEESVEGLEIHHTLGVLAVSPEAKEGTAFILASLESEGRTLVARKQITTYLRPNLEIQGPDQVYIPLPEDGDGKIPYEALHVRKVTSIDVLGSPSLTIPREGEAASLYTSLVFDERGLKMEGEPVIWSLEKEASGVSICQEGVLSLSGEAPEGSVTVTASSVTEPDTSGSITVKLTHEETEKDEPFEEEGSPNGGPEEDYEVHITSVNWKLTEDQAGICISEDGVLTVSPDAPETTVTLQALLEVFGIPVTLEKTVSLMFSAAAVEVSGSSKLVIPLEGEREEPYLAEVRDKQGRVMESEPVSWSLKEPVPGAAVDNLGVLTVSPKAGAGLITLQAAAASNPSVYGSFEITLLSPEEEEPGQEPHTEENLEGEADSGSDEGPGDEETDPDEPGESDTDDEEGGGPPPEEEEKEADPGDDELGEPEPTEEKHTGGEEKAKEEEPVNIKREEEGSQEAEEEEGEAK